MSEFREYRLVAEIGLSPQEIDETPGARLDWLLLVHDTVQAVRAEKEQQHGRSHGAGPVRHL